MTLESGLIRQHGTPKKYNIMQVPTLSEIQSQIIASFESFFGTISRRTKSTFTIMSQVLAAQILLIYQSIARVQKNIFPDLADTEALGGTLERFGRAKLGRDPFPATQGLYSITVTGAIGGIISAGSTFKNDLNYLYTVDSTFTLTATSEEIEVRSITPGTEAELTAGDSLTATAPILDVDSDAIVFDILSEPIAAETTEEYRALILQSYRLESQGGASGDYRIWSADAQGVRTVYPYLANPGEIKLYIEANPADSTDGNGTPTQAIIDEVEQVVTLDPDTSKEINERGRLPLDVWDIEYLSIVTNSVNIYITGYTGVIADDQTLIEDAINEYVFDIRPYISGADVDDNSTLSINRIISVVSDTVAADFTTITLDVLGTPYNTYTFLEGNIPTLTSVNITA